MKRGRPVLVLTGCTASGKTEAVLRLADRVPLEVVSADSRQIYRGMDIGTAKPSAEERKRVPHHLLDILDPDQRYSAGSFAREAMRLIPEIESRGRVPVVVGGTVLYLIALTGGLDELPGTDAALRSSLASAGSATPGLLRRMLQRLDPQSAAKISPMDSVRTVRALEIILLSGRKASSLRLGGRMRKEFRIVSMEIDRGELRKRIAVRTSAMLSAGLVDETRALLSKGYGRDSAVGRTIGYSEALDSIEGRIREGDLQDMVETATWRYARRQRNMVGRLRLDAVLDGGGADGIEGLTGVQEGSDAEGR